MEIEGNNNNNSYNNMEKTGRLIYKKSLKDIKPTSQMSSCEKRLIRDINELIHNKDIGKSCEIIIGEYEKITDTNNFQIIMEFKNYFEVKFIFLSQYPFVPPIITYHSGIKSPSIFDSEGNIILENASKDKWTPILWLSTLVKSIELLILKECNNKNDNINNYDAMFTPRIIKYGKRKWSDYLKDETNLFRRDISVINELTKKIKGIKS